MSSLAIFCLLLAASSALALELPAVDGEEVSNVEQKLQELFGNYDSHRESQLVYERMTNSQEETFSWMDCGGNGSLFHLKNLSVSPLPLHLPGNVIVAYNATVNSDIEAPISVNLRVKRKDGAKWVNVCKDIPGGCELKDICSTERKHTAAATEGGDSEDVSENPICQMKKGDFSLPPTSFPLTTKLSSGYYSVTALFLKGKRRIACVYVRLNIA